MNESSQSTQNNINWLLNDLPLEQQVIGADTAMKLSTNYPAGPFDWLGRIGVDYTVAVLNNLFEAYRSECYRVNPLLQQRYWISRMPS